MEAQAIDVEQPELRAPAQLGTDFEVFEQLYPKLRRFAAVVADLDVDPDDLVQDALVATIARHDLATLDSPQAYLKRSILNVASNKRRRAGRLRGILPRLATDASVTDHYPSDLSLLDHLGQLDRAVIYLADVERLPHDDIAKELGLSAAAVRKRASRARTQLRALIDEPHPTDATIRSQR